MEEGLKREASNLKLLDTLGILPFFSPTLGLMSLKATQKVYTCTVPLLL